MKNFLSGSFAAVALLTVTSAFAAPAANQQGPGYYGDRRPDYREPDRRDNGPHRPDGRYDRDARCSQDQRYDRGPGYGYEPAPIAYPLPQPRRPVAVAIQIHL